MKDFAFCEPLLHIPHPVLLDNGKPVYVLIPIDSYLKVFGFPAPKSALGQEETEENQVRRLMEGGLSALRAWRTVKGLLQQDMAERMGISRPAYTQMEIAARPRNFTLQKAAQAMNLEPDQIISLYPKKRTR